MLQPRSIELYRALGVLEDIQKIAVPLPVIKTCAVGQGEKDVLGISDVFPYLEPTASRPYVSTNLKYNNFY